MAKGKDATRTRIENIKTELQTISSCTTTTVAEVRDLLAVKNLEASQKENIRVKKSQLLSAQPPARRKAGAATAAEAAELTPPLAPRERYVLATEIANTTLKSLADALKTQPPTNPRSTAKSKPPAVDVQKPSKLRTTHTSVTRPLKERSVSQIINSPKKPSSLRRSSSYSSFLASGPEAGLVATAECARIAFGYLATPEAFKVVGKDSPKLQLENGMLALVGKLVAHSMDNLAVKEMRALKKRLDQYLVQNGGKDARPTLNRTLSEQTCSPTKESLASLLEFGEVDRKSPALPIITNLQTYVLRVLARTKRPEAIEAVWKCLKLSHPSSPANLIYQTAKSADNPAKAARQLESLAQTILLLCPSISSSDDRNEHQPSPDVALCLQHLAFRIRQKWWSLAKHEGNEEKELLDPFSKCLAAFSRRSRLPPSKKYKLAESLLIDLIHAGREADSTATSVIQVAPLASKSLGSLAQAAGLYDEALRWLGTSSSPASTDSAAKTATQLVRVATVSLEACLKESPKDDIQDTIAIAMNALSDGLGGSATELDSLFMEINALRRTATRILSSSLLEANRSIPETLLQQCVYIIASSVRFTSRFIGKDPTTDSDKKSRSRYVERLSMALKLAKSTFDSALVCCKRPLASKSEWIELDALIQDCTSLQSQFEQESDCKSTAGAVPGKDSQSFFVKFSNAYWAIQSHLRKLDVDPAIAIKAMQRSTELLSSRSGMEGQAGLLSMKLERLGEAYDQLDRVKESREAFTRCISSFLGETCVQNILAATTTESASHLLNSLTFDSLVRVLKSHHRSFAKHGSKVTGELAFFDDETLPIEVRGVILEWQLALYQKTLCRNRSWDSSLNSSIIVIAERLVGIYHPDIFPIRRQRVQLALLQLRQMHSDIFPDTPVSFDHQSYTIEGISTSRDCGLTRFGDHLKALSSLTHSLHESVPPISEMRLSFSTWQSLLDSAAAWEDLVGRIDGTEFWLQQIQASVDYLTIKGQEYEALPILQFLVKILELRPSNDSSELVAALCTLALRFLHLGYSGKAGLAFSKAESLVANKTTSTEAKLQWHLGYAEYLLSIGNSTKCENLLSAAAVIAQEDAQFMSLTKPSATLSARVRYNRILADACYVSSLLSMSKGNLKDAARHARQCVVLNRRIWAALEARCNSRKAIVSETNEYDSDAPSKAAFDPLSSMRNEKGIPLAMSVTHDALSSPEFWSLITSLYRALTQHSSVFVNQGLFQEAMYVAEQAEKIAKSIESPSLITWNDSQRAEYWTQSGRLEKAQAILNHADVDQVFRGNHIAKIAYLSSIARMHHLNKRFDDERAGYDRMEEQLEELQSPMFINSIDRFTSDVDSLSQDVAKLSLCSGTRVTRPVKSAKGRAPPTKTALRNAPKAGSRTTRKGTLKSVPTVVSKTCQKPVTPQVVDKSSASEECATLSALRADIIHRRVITDLLQDDISKALQLLDKAESHQEGLARDASHLLVRFRATLAQALQKLAEDLTFNTLPESTIAFPAIPLKGRQSSEGVSAKRPTMASNTTRAGRGKQQTQDDIAETLRNAQGYLVEAHAICAATSSSHTFQQISSALSHVTILLSAVSGGMARGALHPLYAAYMGEAPKCNSLRLMQESIEVEQEPMSREDCLRWPTLGHKSLALASVADFQKDYIDIIPESWNALSLGLNEDKDELHITRYSCGKSPFIIRLPMARHSSRDADEEDFSFADGRREFEEIIELSDFSTRSAKDMTSRVARLEWWTEREALDTKLHELLLNMENIWLGGFKGIFSQHAPQEGLLSRFSKSLENILNRYLPSRRKRGQQQRTKLDRRVLDLFIGLGDPSNEELDLDDALMDLIYFIVDILQFNGERNAYDEIDFDAIVVETFDALRAYHSASQSTALPNAHTILILDKNLHMFPWESLPCLEKLSISRLPSLAALRERLLTRKASTVTRDAQVGHYISTAAGGTSILNPSGDLTHTSKTIKPCLDDMQGPWTHIVNRAPTEQEFEQSLREKELVLYFGHGSGAQFVRSKSVRRLYQGSPADCGNQPGCATTFLFGCSSVHLSDNGIYEPSGMLASYLAAGAPAVVGMLWDVTDKDCDRFAVRAGEIWGLWPESKDQNSADPPPTVKKSKGKGKVALLVEEVESARGTGGEKKKKRHPGQDVVQASSDARERRRGVGLDEAVSEARRACVLRYLNGAAAVVYGIPVFLE